LWGDELNLEVERVIGFGRWGPHDDEGLCGMEVKDVGKRLK
jgi:hypothetical protein